MRPDELDLAQLGLPVTPANVEALRAARAVEDFKDNMLDDEAVRLRLFALAALQRVAGQKLAAARSKPKCNPLADALGSLADAARARGGKLWPTVRDWLIRSLDEGKMLAPGIEVIDINDPAAFADAHTKADLTGVAITFELSDGSRRTVSGATTYAYIMKR